MKKLPLFEQVLAEHSIELKRGAPQIIQMNVGKLCNLACLHCHVEAGPKRTELMTRETMEKVLELTFDCPTVRTVDITGGAPEMNPEFRWLVTQVRKAGIEVIDRSNLTIFYEKGFEELPEFLAHHEVVVIASLPCYSEENVDQQRGRGVFADSIRALRALNELGYGKPGSTLQLHLVYNPLGPSLPPDQAKLQDAYKERLMEDFGIEFHSLYTITNMPIKRFLHALERDGKYEEYMNLLVDSFNPEAAREVMCCDTISICWDGEIFDCDFNQMLELPLGGEKLLVHDLVSFRALCGNEIAFGSHCFGCTAGNGSSCGGSLISS